MVAHTNTRQTAVELSYLTIEEQKEFIDAMEYTQAVPSISQAQRMKKLSREKKLTGTKMREIMGEIKKGAITRVMFNNEQLYRYFPKSYTPAEMKEEILSMLTQRNFFSHGKSGFYGSVSFKLSGVLVCIGRREVC